MRLIKIKEFWDRADNELVMNNSFTKSGLATYWRALDASFKFNVLKRRDYLIRTNFRQLKSKCSQAPPLPRKFGPGAKKQKLVVPRTGTDDGNHDYSPPGSTLGSQIEPALGRSPNPHEKLTMFANMQQFFSKS